MVKNYYAHTDLPNFITFQDKIKEYIDTSKENAKFTIAYLDIDNYRYINETLGHNVGNIFLDYIAENLKAEINKKSILAKLAGGEFAILIPDMGSQNEVIKCLEKIKASICRSWSFFIHNFYVSISVGIAVYPDNGSDMVTLFQNAYIAMYAAKQDQKDIVFFKEDLKENIWWKIKLSNDIQKGMENNEFILYYQPQYNLETNEIIGVEALARWFHPEKGFISPGQFIPVAEETKQIYSLEKWILRQALNQKKRWEKDGLKEIELAINLSSKTLCSDYNFCEVEEIFYSYSVDFSKVVIEITETTLIHNIELAKERLMNLKKLGIKIALDDFGTGYSSLSHLIDLPVDIIKIDSDFIHHLPDSKKEAMIIKNLLLLANDLNIRIVAEGIENQKQLDILRHHSCKYGQGFLYCMPLPAKVTSKLLKDSSEHTA